MISACRVASKGFHFYDYDTRATNNGFRYELASGHPTTKLANSVSAVHGSTTVVVDH
jgi:hypothetical protein